MLYQAKRQEYQFKVFENEIVRVEPAGKSIRISLKGGADANVRDLVHPFAHEAAGFGRTGQWNFFIETLEPNTLKIYFSKILANIANPAHTLILHCPWPKLKPKVIEIDWK